jgi:nitroimidazol reductase NimA-like FMN-containing flavoprotein (pyridoxamine 5'-phosphate oxidase superfamily)
MDAPRSLRTTLRRHPERGRHDAETIAAILDEALICHVGFVADGQPYVVPTIHARRGDELVLHGSTASRMLQTLSAGVPVCVTATVVDGVVMARSVFSSSMNYRSVMVLGAATEVTDDDEKRECLRAVVEHVAPGRWKEARNPAPKELKATAVLRVPLDEASAKVRTGPPKDDEEDLGLPVWAGVVPLRLMADAPIVDADPAWPLPQSVVRLARRFR